MPQRAQMWCAALDALALRQQIALDFWHSPTSSASSSPRAAMQRTSTRGNHMKIRPLQDRLVVKRTPEEEKTKGGIIIPDTAKEKPLEGVVVAVGSGKAI